jgi:AsmA protein
MTPARKKILAVVLACAALAATGILALRLIVDPSAFAPVITGFVQRATGLNVTIGGGLGLTLYPWLGVEVRGLAISDLPGFPGQPFVSADVVDVKVRPLALLRGELEVGGLRLSGLKLRLVRDADGRENWKALPIAKVAVEKDHVVVVKTDGQTSSFRYLVETAEVTGSEAVFEDRAAGTLFAVTDINIRAEDVRPGRPFTARVSLAATSVKPELAAKVELSGASMVDPQAMRFAVNDARLRVEGKAAGLPLAAFALEGTGSLDFSADDSRLSGRGLTLSGTVSGGRFPADGLTARLSAAFDLDSGQGTLSCPSLALALPQTGFAATGTLEATNLQDKPRATLSLSVPPFDVKPLLARAGAPLPPLADANALSKVGLSLQASYLENTEARLEAQISLDGAPVRISAQSTTAGPIRAAVGVGAKTLALDGYLPKPGAAKTAAAAKDAPPAFPGKDDAIDLRLTAERLEVKKLVLTGLDATAALRRGVAEVGRFRAGLAGGSLSGSARAETANPALPVSLRLEGTNLAAGPLLAALAGREPITGTAAVSADLTAQARDENTLVRTLSGKASLSLTNGVIAGLNLSPDVLSSPMSLLTFGLGGADEAPKGGASGTRITSARLSATLKNGQAATKDLQVLAPPHKVTGQGTVDLPGRTLDMRLLAHVAGVADIPVAVTGSLDDPSVTPDLAAIPAGAVTGAAGAAVKALTDPGGTAKGVLDAVNPLNLLPFGQKKK